MLNYFKALYQHLFCPPCIYSMTPEQSAEIRRLTELANKISKGEYISSNNIGSTTGSIHIFSLCWR